MCGILAAFGLTGDPEKNRRELLRLSKLIRHRGPDGTGVYVNPHHGVYMSHERLTIVDTSDRGKQPFIVHRPEGDLVWAVNGEIYNHESIRASQFPGQDLGSKSDCAVTGYLYQKHGAAGFSHYMDGMFAAVAYDEAKGEFVITRDELGKASLYWGRGRDGAIWVASEMKALQEQCVEFFLFPPGHYLQCNMKAGVNGTHTHVSLKEGKWYNAPWTSEDLIPKQPADFKLIHDTFVSAVVKRLMTDVPFGVLLSGGLDSSLVAAVAVRHLRESRNTYNPSEKIHTFSIGIKDAPDLKAARKVADFLGTEHHEFHFTVEEGLDAIRDLIWHIESYEQVRAAVPMYLLSRKIKASGIKMVLSGEGADEIYGGYLYFHKAPSPEEFHRETVRKTVRLHQWDVLRANKSTFAWGLEARTPFLDREFIEVSMSLDPKEKMCNRAELPDGKHPRLEKYLLRKAFDDQVNPYLPEDVLWRQKEQFSDGVGYDWVDGLKEYANRVVPDELWAARATRFPIDTPRTREYYMLRALFEEQFPSRCALDTVPKGLSVACSTPEAVSWDPSWANMHEISGRAIKDVHDEGGSFQSMDAGFGSGGKGNGAGVAAAAKEGRAASGAGASAAVVGGATPRGGKAAQAVGGGGGGGSVRRLGGGMHRAVVAAPFVMPRLGLPRIASMRTRVLSRGVTLLR